MKENLEKSDCTHLSGWGLQEKCAACTPNFHRGVSNVIGTIRSCNAWHDTWIKKGWGASTGNRRIYVVHRPDTGNQRVHLSSKELRRESKGIAL